MFCTPSHAAGAPPHTHLQCMLPCALSPRVRQQRTMAASSGSHWLWSYAYLWEESKVAVVP
jgi:hypothetical protein